MSVRKLVEGVLSPAMTRKIWSSSYAKVLPVTVQDFDLSAVLPAVFYMFRFGHRRGKGRFLEEFSPVVGTPAQMRRSTTVEAVANKLADKKANGFTGFDGDAERAVLADLLLCYCLDNVGNKLGRTRQVQRVAPTHYVSSWVDLPEWVANLRYVPEMMVAVLADQKKGGNVQRSEAKGKTWFPVGEDVHSNVLLQPFVTGLTQKQIKDDYAADQFDEEVAVGIDQLLMIRVAQSLRRAPGKIMGRAEMISNQRPIATVAARHFSEDIRKYVRSYATQVPRQAFVESLESCVAIGLTTITSSAIGIVLDWASTGEVLDACRQRPAPLLVDCSIGTHRQLRGLAEQSMDEYVRCARRFPVVLMALRILDYKARYDRKIRTAVDVSSMTGPYATEWLGLLGDLLHERHGRSDIILSSLDEQTQVLAETVKDDYPAAATLLTNHSVEPNPVWRLAEGLTLLQGEKVQSHTEHLIDSGLYIGRPNGLAVKRRSRQKIPGSGFSRATILRSLSLTDSVLDYLVHRLSLKSGGGSGTRWLSFDEFIATLRERYGFFVDVSPAGMSVSNDLLQLNRAALDRRLRDLGLLVSVNDAEAMKRLTPRFNPREG
ncbi:MAG: hypothetical protein F4107_07115 [Gemmatimonadetes bacterium]|nr:hypothetical protein [Gemmatimonadota bacterium]MYI65690.1 hypothetical protein [Gemmatimonadota bacterium]